VGGAAAEPRRFCADARLPGRVRRRGRASRGGAGSRRRRPWEGGVHHCPQQPDADHWRRRRCCGRRPGRWRCHLPLYAQPQRWGRGPRPSRRRQRRRRWRGAEELHGGRGRRRWSWVGRPRGTLHRPCAARERRRKQRRRSGPLPVRWADTDGRREGGFPSARVGRGGRRPWLSSVGWQRRRTASVGQRRGACAESQRRRAGA